MKKTINLLLLLCIFLTTQAQIIDWEDYSPPDTSTRTAAYAPYGRDFSPHDTIRVMIIYAGFYQPGVYTDPEYFQHWSNDNGNGLHTNVPNYIYNEDYPIFFTDAAQLNDPSYANVFNLTRFYHDVSQGDFIMLGDVFRDPYPNSNTFGEPIRINIDPSTVSSSWYSCNKKVLEKIRDEYGVFWDNIWAPYDNRDNYPNYQFDNSVVNADGTPASGDGVVDYVIIHWRYDKNWQNQPKDGMDDWSGSGGGVTSLANLSYSDFSISEGFTSTKGGMSSEDVVMFFPHEFAHEVYNCPHVMGANTTRGNKFYFPTVGWGMMSASGHLMVGTNAWEAYMLGWNDLEVGGFNTKIDAPSDLNTSASYRLYDYALTGDAIRVKIPFSDDYLWIENHQKKTSTEFKAWAGKNPSSQVSTSVIPDFEKGIYMYVEDLEDDINSYSVNASTYDLLNEIKVLNAVGNWDYQRSEYPKLNPNNSDYSDGRYMWNNLIYTFERTEENPISGINPYFSYFDDYHYYKNIDGDGTVEKLHLENPDGVIETDFNHNYGTLEARSLHNEIENNLEELTYAGTGGRNQEAITLGRRSDAFQVGDEISINGIIPVLNNPDYSVGTAKLNPYYLNGLKIEITNQILYSGAILVEIAFDDYELYYNKRWCGDIILPDISGDEQSDLIIDEDVLLTIDKSGTPNTHVQTSDGDFINPSNFTLDPDSKLQIESYGQLLVTENSKLTLKNGSKLVIGSYAKVIIDENALLQYEGGEIVLESSSSCLEIRGNLNIADNIVFTFTGGYIKFSNPGDDNTQNITCGSGASIVLQGSGQNDKIMEVQQSRDAINRIPTLLYS